MIDVKRLRTLLGCLGMFLPWIVVLLIKYFPQSISATWYTNASTVFMIILGSACLLLISYSGYDKQDDIVSTLAGIFGLGICIFPCRVDEVIGKVGTFNIDCNISNILHSLCAVVFFLLLSYNSFFLFTKTDGNMTREKKVRNIIYKVCGIGMMLSFALLLLPEFYIQVWLVETIALFFFGVSWLTKSQSFSMLFKDKENK